MAVFLLKTKHGSTYVPPACAGVFADVPCPGVGFADWIEDSTAGASPADAAAAPLLPDDSDTAAADGGVPRQDLRAQLYGD